MTTTEYRVTGMSCGHCESSVREEVARVAGVSDVQVSARDGVLRVLSDAPLPDAEVLAAVDEAGYSAVRL